MGKGAGGDMIGERGKRIDAVARVKGHSMKNKFEHELADVKRSAAGEEAEALKNQWAVTIAIVDDGNGHGPLVLKRFGFCSGGDALDVSEFEFKFGFHGMSFEAGHGINPLPTLPEHSARGGVGDDQLG